MNITDIIDRLADEVRSGARIEEVLDDDEYRDYLIFMTTTNATDAQIEQLRLHAVNDVTREIMAHGVLLSHEQADDLGEEVLDWMGRRLGLTVRATDVGVECTPRGREITKAELEGRKDAEDFLSETPRDEWPDAIKAGKHGADEGLISALGVERAAKLLGVDVAYEADGVLTDEAYAAFRAYSRAWEDCVRSAIAEQP